MKKIFLFLLSLEILSSVSGQVNLQTGGATFSLPMFTWQDDKSRLNSSIVLNYSSGNGLKVNDVSTNIGQGWNLTAGGVITRMQAGEPDDQKPRDGGTEDITKYPPGYLYDPLSAVSGVSTALTKYPIFKGKNHVYKQHNAVAADKELDHFAFQFNGRSGLFVLGKNNEDKGVLLGDSKIKVWFVRNESMPNIRTTISAFYIQDEKGLIYKFTQHALTKVLRNNYCDAGLVGSQTQPDFKSNKVYHEAGFEDPNLVNPYIINGWYLTEVEDALTHRKITLTYVIRNINAKAGTSISSYQTSNYSILSHAVSKTQSPELSAINYPDGHQVAFNYGKARVDLIGDYALASVDITYQNRFISKYELTTSYFILNRYGTPVSDYQKSVARLCLRSVKKIGVDLKEDEPPYLFDYNMGSSNPDDFIPPPFFHIKDIWGFYNGDYSRDYDNAAISLNTPLSNLSHNQLMGLCFLRRNTSNIALNAKPGYAKNGLLKQITYPTGGTLKYEYEQNTAILTGQNTNVGGVHVSATSVTDGGYSNDCNNPLRTTYTYNLSAGSSQSSLWGVEMPRNSINMVSHYEPEHKYFYWKPILDFGCKYHYQYPGILAREQSIDLTSHQKFMQTLSVIMDIVSGVMLVIDVITLCMYGTPAAWVAVILDVICSVVNIIITCTADHSRDTYTTVYYNTDVNGTNPLPSQFKRVEIVESTGANGKTVMEFTSSDDYPVWEPANPSLSSKQRFAYWAYGLPKKITLYNASGNLVKQTENIYDFSKANKLYVHYKLGYNLYPSCKYLVTKNYSQRNVDWEDPNRYKFPDTYTTTSNNDMMVDIYGVRTGRVELVEKKERVYKTSNPLQFLETKTSYAYSLRNYQLKTITTMESNGNTIQKNFTYNDDYYYQSGTILETLTQHNIFTEPVSTDTYIYKPNEGVGYLGETVHEYTTLANGDIRPYRTLEQRFNTPTTSMMPYQGINNPGNAPYKEIQTFIYDAVGNLTGIKDESNRTVTHIYDYNNKYAIATVVNAVSLTDKAAYTSFETNQFGGWVLNGAANYTNTNAVTGVRSLSLSASNSLTTGLTTSKAYRLSFWAGNSVTVTGNATLVKAAPTINGFTYYEYNIAQGTSAVSISGNTTMDELRIYPQTARMKTVSYDPLIGKTSECDENNRITYYEYDNLGRLRFIKDENKNTVKMYEYNVAKKPVCPVTYSNLKVTEIFTRNNCPAGYIGSTVIYTIPAGTYTSTISQAAVDQQVENDLNSNGQNYANANGTCIQLFYNTALSQQFTKENCPIGYKGTTITYSVPAGKYNSTISQADANEKAQAEINANGQAYANAPGNASCIIDNQATWIGTGAEQCQNGHRMVQVMDMNPNSSTYNQTQWIDTGADPTCPASPTTIYIRLERTEDYSYSDAYCSIESTNYYIRYYADAAGTMPFNLSANLPIHFNYNSWEQTYYDSYYYNYNDIFTGAAGTHQYHIGYTQLSYWTYYWPPEFTQGGTNYTLLPGANYSIIN